MILCGKIVTRQAESFFGALWEQNPTLDQFYPVRRIFGTLAGGVFTLLPGDLFPVPFPIDARAQAALRDSSDTATPGLSAAFQISVVIGVWHAG
jgi:hypothetical protein